MNDSNGRVHINTSVGRSAKTYIYQNYATTWLRLEDLPRAMADWDRWLRESRESGHYDDNDDDDAYK